MIYSSEENDRGGWIADEFDRWCIPYFEVATFNPPGSCGQPWHGFHNSQHRSGAHRWCPGQLFGRCVAGHAALEPACLPRMQPPLSDQRLPSLLPCPHCGHKQPKRHFVVLITSVILCVLLQFFPLHGLNFWATIPLLIYLGVIVVIDLEHRLVLVETSLFGLILMLGYGITIHGFLNALRGALGGMLIMLALFLLGMALGKVVGILRHKAISEVPFGFGDVVFGTILGLLCGWPSIAAGLLLGIILFSAYSVLWLISLILTRRYKSFTNAQALTPFLILGSIILFYLR